MSKPKLVKDLENKVRVTVGEPGIKDAERQLRAITEDPMGFFAQILTVDQPSRWAAEFHYRKKNSKGEFTNKTYTAFIPMVYDPFTGKKLEP